MNEPEQYFLAIVKRDIKASEVETVSGAELTHCWGYTNGRDWFKAGQIVHVWKRDEFTSPAYIDSINREWPETTHPTRFVVFSDDRKVVSMSVAKAQELLNAVRHNSILVTSTKGKELHEKYRWEMSR